MRILRLKLILFTLFLISTTNGQELNNESKTACEQRAKSVLKELKESNSDNFFLREMLEHGDRGDCIHHSWMDEMRQLKIKQAWFVIEYKWKNKQVIFKIKRVSYLSNYLSDEIKDKDLLRRIIEGGLDKKLSDVVLGEAKKSPFAE